MMYHKFIGDREVFNDGSKIEIDNFVYRSPTHEMMVSQGWEILPPPVPEPIVPTPQTKPDEWQIMQAVIKMLAPECEGLSDKDALQVAALFPTFDAAVKAGKIVPAGHRLWNGGKLWKVKQAHVPMSIYPPEENPSLYMEVSIAETPDWVQPIDAQTAYNTGEQVKHNGHKWESSVDNNVWEPGVYGWTDLGEIS